MGTWWKIKNVRVKSLSQKDARRLSYSVIETARILAECSTGSRDGYSDEKLDILASWLAWRTTDGWDASSGHNKDYEDSVLAMAKAALRMHGEKEEKQ